jgi:uncharacterized membrane protein
MDSFCFIKRNLKTFTIFGGKMSEQPELNDFEPEITSDDKLWVLLTYVLSPLVPVIILLLEDKKNRPFIKAHNAQALVLGAVNLVLGFVLGWTVVLSCVPLIIWIYMVYLGIQGYQGQYVNIPVVTDFVKNQGWAD